MLLAALGLGLASTVLALAWGGVASRLERSAFVTGQGAAAATLTTPATAVVVLSGSAEWVLEDGAP